MIKKKYLLLAFMIVVMITAFKAVRMEKLNEECLGLTLEGVPPWLKKHKINVPEDLESHIGLNVFVLDVIKNAENGIDSSSGVNHTKTSEFIREIQKAAGYTFN